MPADLLADGRRWFLDLGRVEVIAEVKLNNRDLGTLWKPPFRVEVTGPLKPGDNPLEVKVVNLWVNRMIGDEQLPETASATPAGTQWIGPGGCWKASLVPRVAILFPLGSYGTKTLP